MENVTARQRQIYFAAAKLFVAKGFAATSMGDIADAVGMSKAGLYHSIACKEDLLFTVTQFGMDRLFIDVVEPARLIANPLERLELILRNHIANIGRGSGDAGNPMTIVVDEVSGLSPERLQTITQRKREYLDLVRSTLDELGAAGLLHEDVDTRVAALSFLNMVLAVARWRKPRGALSLEQITQQIIGLAFRSVLKDPPAQTAERQ